MATDQYRALTKLRKKFRHSFEIKWQVYLAEALNFESFKRDDVADVLRTNKHGQLLSSLFTHGRLLCFTWILKSDYKERRMIEILGI